MMRHRFPAFAALLISGLFAVQGDPPLRPPQRAQDEATEEDQDKKGEEQPPGTDIFGRPRGDTASALEGAWQLTEIQDRRLPEGVRSHVGYMLVSGSFLSLEIHVTYDDDEGGFALFQSGMHEFHLDEFGRLSTVTLIGSRLDEVDDLRFEPAGLERRYQVEVTGTILHLTRADGSRFTFTRKRSTRGVEYDAFGRPIGGDKARSFFVQPPKRKRKQPVGDDR